MPHETVQIGVGELVVNDIPAVSEVHDVFFGSSVASLAGHHDTNPVDKNIPQKEQLSADALQRAEKLSEMLALGTPGIHHYLKAAGVTLKREVIDADLYNVHKHRDNSGQVTMRFRQHQLGFDSRFGKENGTGWRGKETLAVLEVRLQRDTRPGSENAGWYFAPHFLENDNLANALATYDSLRRSDDEAKKRGEKEDEIANRHARLKRISDDYQDVLRDIKEAGIDTSSFPQATH